MDITRDEIRNSPALSKAESTFGGTGNISAFDYSILDPAGECSPLGPEPGIIGAFDPQQLHGTDEVKGYAIHATDGDIGHMADFILDDESWVIRYLVVDTGGWWPGRKVLLSPEWIESVSWCDNKVFVSVTRESIKTAPDYDPFGPPTRDYEEKIFDHYQMPKYWIVLEVIREAGFGGTEDRQRP